MFEHVLVRPNQSSGVILGVMFESYLVAAPVGESDLLGARLVKDRVNTDTSEEAKLGVDDLKLLSNVGHDLSNLVLAPHSLGQLLKRHPRNLQR